MSFTNQQYCCITYKDKFHNEYVTLWKDIIHSKGPQKTHRTQYFLRLFLALLPPGNQQLFRQPQRLQIQQKPLGCRSCQGKGGHGARPLGQTCGFLQRGARYVKQFLFQALLPRSSLRVLLQKSWKGVGRGCVVEDQNVFCCWFWTFSAAGEPASLCWPADSCVLQHRHSELAASLLPHLNC